MKYLIFVLLTFLCISWKLGTSLPTELLLQQHPHYHNHSHYHHGKEVDNQDQNKFSIADFAEHHKIVGRWDVNSSVTNETIAVRIYRTAQFHYKVWLTFFRECDTKIDEDVLEAKKLAFPLSDSTATSRLIRKTLGADEMYVRIEGATLQSYLLRTEDCSSYHHKFNIPISGAYNMRVIRLRSEYAAAKETILKFPDISYETIVNEWLYLNATNSKDGDIRCANHSSGGEWVEVRSLEGKSRYSDLSDAKTFSQITYTAPRDRAGQQSRDLNLDSYVNVTDNLTGEGCANDISNYRWMSYTDCRPPLIRTAASDSIGTSKFGLISTVSKSEASDIMANMTITFVGDSHTRLLSNSLLEWACGMPVDQKLKVTKTIGFPSNNPLCAGAKVNYIQNYFCGSIPSSNDQDMFVLNCGQHPASNYHFTIGAYEKNLLDQLKVVESKGFTNQNFFWLETNPQPVRRDKFVFEFEDWRTLHRLHAYNEVANNIIRRGNYSVIAAFGSTLPFIERLCDNAHFSATDILVPVFIQLLTQLQVIKQRKFSLKST